ncbi:hypothetical protein PG994_008118 [Apiospora phragmitis]|uniref:Uncharacterized protein n=1 Tax=Apiospora phragmitis TaxID=2905665 RepID=A0ABR1US73_9PEZI
METDSQVYLGVWTNWSRGSATMGATLTTTRENGNLLIAFTALFVRFLASRFWRIFAILFHQWCSTADSRDTIHHQRQVILRNSSSPESGLMSFIRLMWAWRHTSRRSWSRILPVALFTFFFIGTFTVAGGFSSQISTSGEVLLKGDNCEVSSTEYRGNFTLSTIVYSYWAAFTNNIHNNAEQCYSDQSSGILECSRFVTKAVPTAVMDYDTPCPFKGDICRQNSANLRLDTGHLNSNDVFGLNAPKDETLTVRYVLQCAPLATEGHTFINTFSNHNFTSYNYGEMNGNVTYAVPDLESQYAMMGYKSPSDSFNFVLGVAPWFGLTSKDFDSDRPASQTKLGPLLIWAHLTALFESSLDSIMDSLGSSSLASLISLSQGFMFSIKKKNQWQLDVTQWWHIVLAGLQAKFVNTAQGYTDSTLRPGASKPENVFQWDFCRNQKIRSAQYANFNIFGLVFMYTLGALIIVISFIIEPILGFLQKRGRYNKYAYLEWEGDTAIQLHRVAQDQIGYGQWTHCDQRSPITQLDDLLAPLDICNPKHRMLARDINSTALEESKSYNGSQGLSDEPIPQESSLKHHDDGFPGNASVGARRACSNAHTFGPRGKRFQSVDGDLENYQNRPGTVS